MKEFFFFVCYQRKTHSRNTSKIDCFQLCLSIFWQYFRLFWSSLEQNTFSSIFFLNDYRIWCEWFASYSHSNLIEVELSLVLTSISEKQFEKEKHTFDKNYIHILLLFGFRTVQCYPLDLFTVNPLPLWMFAIDNVLRKSK